MSHLFDLYRRRQRSKNHAEDFASTALAWLIQSDQQACRALLGCLLGDAAADVADLARRVVTTQITVRADSRPDVRIDWLDVEGKRHRLYLEAKLGLPVTPAVAGQIRRYEEATRTTVGLLCAEAKLPGPKEKEWAGIPRTSWEAVIRSLRRLDAHTDEAARPPLRHEFVELMKRFGIDPVEPLSESDLRAAPARQARLKSWNDSIKQGLLAWLPKLPANTEDPWDWSVDGPLAGSWARERAPAGFPLTGVGLQGEASRVGAAWVLSWTLQVYVAPSAEARFRPLLQREDWRAAEAGWWEREVSVTVDLEAPGDDVLREVLEEAADVLKADFALTTPPLNNAGPSTTVASILSDVYRSDRVAHALRRVATSRRETLVAALAASHPDRNVRLATRGQYRNISLDGRDGGVRWAGTWAALDRPVPAVGIWVSYNTKGRHDALWPAFQTFGSGQDFEVARTPLWSQHFHVFVPASPVKTLEQRLDRAIERVARWCAEHRGDPVKARARRARKGR